MGHTGDRLAVSGPAVAIRPRVVTVRLITRRSRVQITPPLPPSGNSQNTDETSPSGGAPREFSADASVSPQARAYTHDLIGDSGNVSPEEWRSVPGLENLVEVSTRGRVRNPRLGRVLAGSRSLGYLHVRLSVGGVRRDFTVHELVALAFHGPRPAGHDVDHIDHDRANNAPENLRYLTASQNRGARACSKCRKTGHLAANCHLASAPSALTDLTDEAFERLLDQGLVEDGAA